MTLRGAAEMLIGSGIVLAVGEIMLTLFSCSALVPRAPMAMLTGAVVSSILLLVGSFGSGVPSGALLLWSGVIVLPLAGAVAGWRQVPRTTDWRDLAALLVVAVIVAIWCRGFAQTAPILDATGRLHAWSDYYVHGAQLAEFGDPLAAGRGSILLADYPRVFYHYGMYMLPSAVLGAVNASGMAIATAVLAPLGLLLALAASYLLASQFAGRLAGVAAIAGLTLLPDAARYGFENGFYSFYWLLFTTPGAGYGIAACCVALILLHDWQRTRATATLIGALVMTIAIFQMRVHFLIWLAPALAISFLLQSKPARSHPWRWLGGAGAAAFAAIIAVAAIAPARQLWLAHSAVVPYLNFIYRANEPTAYPGLYDRIIARTGELPGLFAGTLLLLPAAVGALLLLYPIALKLAKQRAGWRWGAFDTLPLALIAVFFAMVLYAPHDPWGDISEYQHRSFVLLYAVLIIWIAQYLVTAIGGLAAERRLAVAWLGAVCVAAAAIAATGFDPARPRFAWGKEYYDVAADPGIIAAARWIRLHPSDAKATVAVGPVDPKAYIVDTATALASLTNTPTFLARAASQLKQDDSRRNIAIDRMDRLQRVERSADAEAAMLLLREANVTSYAWVAPAPPGFDPGYARASFHDDHGAVYLVDGRAH
ncbi:MAG TPA: hypothetical protein VGC77_10135 [Rhodopseudomonas sp.]|uniref:hypothetical protein n=1 Tax=Rhodopseudomonas sp. TaxID=1078 RepID=UPI002ED857CE